MSSDRHQLEKQYSFENIHSDKKAKQILIHSLGATLLSTQLLSLNPHLAQGNFK